MLMSVALAEESPALTKDPEDKKPLEVVEKVKEVTAEVLPVPLSDVIEDRQDTYGAPALDNVQYVAPVYASPVASVVVPEDSYVSAQTPEASYVAPPAVSSQAGTQGYYYYYYPVSTSPVQSPTLPQYAPPRQGFVGANSPLANVGTPVIIAIIVGVGIIIGIGILIAATFSSTSTTTTSTSGRSLLDYANASLNEAAHYVYEGLQVWSEINGAIAPL